jgi:two-component system, cell cycle sensor histidine kinase and response regulator CckA
MDTPRVELDEVIATSLLGSRPRRARDLRAEARALDQLRRALAGSPRALLQKLADVLLDLCGAHSAGVSLLEAGEPPFCRWYAVSGEYAGLLWSTLPCAFSPCGLALKQCAPILLVSPQRRYAALAPLTPPAEEVLMVPFALRGVTVGTVWAVSHDPHHVFDAGDSRIVTALTEFAALAYERLLSLSAGDVLKLSRMQYDEDSEPYPG